MKYGRLKDLREDADKTQEEISEVLGIDRRTYSRYETGKNEIPARHVVKLAKYYNTTTDYIYGLTNIRKWSWKK